MRKALRALAWLAAIQIVVAIVGQILSKRMTSGDEKSKEFKLAAIMTGRQFRSESDQLRSGKVLSAMGGVDLDLRGATLDAGGAHLDLTAAMGGIRVVVPGDWAVDVASETRAGGCETSVTPAEQLPEDAPRLDVHAVARLGGVLVTTEV